MIACHHCDALYEEISLVPGKVAYCQRCKTVLYQLKKISVQRSVALSLTAFILIIIANYFPIVSIKFQGITTKANLADVIFMLWQTQHYFLAAVVLLTIILFPLIETVLLLYILVPLLHEIRPPGFNRATRALITLQAWCMVEVFALGIVVTLVKLFSYTQIEPHAALFAFAALVITLNLLATVEPKTFWDIPYKNK